MENIRFFITKVGMDIDDKIVKKRISDLHESIPKNEDL